MGNQIFDHILFDIQGNKQKLIKLINSFLLNITHFH